MVATICLESALAVSRSRSSWNSWLEQAEKPASDHEEAQIERAANMATAIVTANQFLNSIGVRVFAQGSYYNNTNTRNEADMRHQSSNGGDSHHLWGRR